MSKFVIRGMSTTDFDSRIGPDSIVPYHIYLKPAGHRGGAWWTTSLLEAETFETKSAAWDEALRAFPKGGIDVAPIGDPTYPTHWDNEKLARRDGAIAYHHNHTHEMNPWPTPDYRNHAWHFGWVHEKVKKEGYTEENKALIRLNDPLAK